MEPKALETPAQNGRPLATHPWVIWGYQHWEAMAWLAVLLVAAALRLPDLGSRALHHDEAQHARFSWDLYMGRGYAYNPMLHGPFLYYIVALTYYLFGVSDATARLAPAVFGIGLVALTIMLRGILGRGPALLSGLLVAVSPSILYYSRSLRHDIFATFGALLLAIGLLNYLRERRPLWVYVASLGLIISYSSHELTFITVFIFGTYLGLGLLQDLARGRAAWHASPLVQAASALFSQPRVLVTALMVLLVPYTLLYTSFFTNLKGFTDGLTASISYWLAQQGVQRGSQPWYYYLLLLPSYEPIPVIFGVGGILRLLVTRERTTKFPDVRAFLAYWAVLALVIYSWAGEKMPWLTVQMALPLTLVASITLAGLLRAMDWPRLWPRGAVAALWIALAAAAVVAVYSIRTPASASQMAAQVRLAQMGFVAILAVVFAALGLRSLLSLGRNAGWVPPLTLLTGVLAIHTFHNTVTLNFYNGANPIEMMVYVQTTPQVPAVANRILDLSEEATRFDRSALDPTGGHSLVIALDNAAEWPFDWYLRDLVNVRYFNRQVPSIPKDAPVVIAAAENEDVVRPFLGDKYVAERHALRWWLQESYKRVTLGSLISSPLDYLRAGMNYFLFRRVDEPLGSYDFILYIRKDMAERYLGVSTQERTYGLTDTPGEGSSPGQFSQPRGIASGHDGSIYVVDTGNLRVQKFDASGKFVAQWGQIGSGDGQFALVQGFGPTGIAVGPDGSVYVADTWNHRIQHFAADGKFLGKWGQYGSARQGDPSAQLGFYGPRGIAVDSRGTVYVTDTGNRRVMVFDAQGNFIRQFGSFGTGPGQFDEPIGITFDGTGNLLVADTRNQRIQRLAPDGSYLGQFPAHWSTAGINEVYLAVDSRGEIIATDPLGHRILVYEPSGKLKAEVTTGSAGALSLPTGVTIAPDGTVYVTDVGKHAVVRVEIP